MLGLLCCGFFSSTQNLFFLWFCFLYLVSPLFQKNASFIAPMLNTSINPSLIIYLSSFDLGSDHIEIKGIWSSIIQFQKLRESPFISATGFWERVQKIQIFKRKFLFKRRDLDEVFKELEIEQRRVEEVCVCVGVCGCMYLCASTLTYLLDITIQTSIVCGLEINMN